MRIAYVNADPGVPVFGTKGSSIHVQEVIASFLKRGAKIHLFASRCGHSLAPAAWRRQMSGGVCIHRLPEALESDLKAREESALAANETLQERLRQCEVDFVYERYSLWSFAGMEHARERRIPGILEVNAPLIEEQSAYRGLLDRRAAECVAERAFDAATALVVVSEELAEYLSRYPAAQGKIHVIPNGISPARFRGGVSPLWPGELESFTVGFVGSLRPWHGLLTLIDAFERLHQTNPQARLLIVGAGPEHATITAELARRGLAECSRLTGAVDPDAVPGWLASLDVAVAPYPRLHNFYFSPLKVYEYMAAARAVVASEIGQLRTLIQHGVNGWHVEPGNPAALAEALKHLSHNPDLRERLGKAARKMVFAHHTWDATVERILNLATQARSDVQSNSATVEQMEMNTKST